MGSPIVKQLFSAMGVVGSNATLPRVLRWSSGGQGKTQLQQPKTEKPKAFPNFFFATSQEMVDSRSQNWWLDRTAICQGTLSTSTIPAEHTATTSGHSSVCRAFAKGWAKGSWQLQPLGAAANLSHANPSQTDLLSWVIGGTPKSWSSFSWHFPLWSIFLRGLPMAMDTAMLCFKVFHVKCGT